MEIIYARLNPTDGEIHPFPIFSEFERCVRALDCFNPNCGFFRDIKKKLYRTEAEKVIGAFVAYADAYKSAKHARQLMNENEGCTFAEWQGYIWYVSKKNVREEKKFVALKIIVYGEEVDIEKLYLL